MNFEDIVKANESIKQIEFKGSHYAVVAQRVKAFRMIQPNGSIVTELLSDDGDKCVFKATISDVNGIVLGTGTAYEYKNSSFVNKTSYIENCETSAVGRALAMCGIGIDMDIASAEEVINAENNKPEVVSKEEMMQEVEARAKVIGYVNKVKMPKENIEKLCKHFGVKSLNELNLKQCNEYLKMIEEKEKSNE